jgi:hemerythrin-like domain-containing protein
MSASDVLRKDHEEIMKLEKVISSCYQNLYEGHHIPFTDIEKITFLISEFLDSIHFTREEGSYFPCVASYDTLRKEISALLIEHEFSRNIAKKLSEYLAKWKNGEDMREPVARYLRTYSIFLIDHMSKEEDFFAKAENTVLSKEEEREMYEQFTSVSTISTKLSELLNEIKQLQEKAWFTNKS